MMNILREEATRLRDNGYSYNMIKERLGVSISTQSNWFADRPFTPNPQLMDRIKNGPMKAAQLCHTKKVNSINKSYRDADIELGALSQRDIWMIGLGIYMGEGSKSIESVRIVNSDPDIIRFAMRWFRDVCKLDNSNFALSINLYPDNNKEAALSYWASITGIPEYCFKKTQIDVRQNKKKEFASKLPHGTLQIRINANGDKAKGVALFRKIKGWSIAAFKQV